MPAAAGLSFLGNIQGGVDVFSFVKFTIEIQVIIVFHYFCPCTCQDIISITNFFLLKAPMGKRLCQTLLRFLWKSTAGVVGLSLLLVILFRFVPVYVTPLMLLRGAEQLTEGKKLQMHHQWVAIEAISKNLLLAVICSEDQHFVKHFGFDFRAIENSLADAEQGRTRLRGASTISQQTAKNVFLYPSRSWVRKGLEAYFTVLIEFCWSKKRILEVYLNSIEMGNGIYGAEAASRHYFKTGALNLSRGQAAAIAAILPNPRKYSANLPNPYTRRRIAWITGQMNRYGTVQFE
jgi:monofunctional glycosyltransferase